MSKKAKWGTQEFTGRLFKFYMQQCDLIEELYQFQFNSQKKNKNQRVEPLYLLLYSMHDTASSIGMLSVNQKINESYMLARALVEKIINYIYLLFCDEEEYERYLSYTKQKGYRNLKKDIKVGELIAELKWSGDFNLNNAPELKRAVELFTSEKKRKPITRWRNLKIEEMLDSIAKRSGLNIKMLMLAMLAIYDDASEALHGTLYGTIFYIGLFSGGSLKTKGEIISSVHGQLSLLYMALGGCIDSLLEAVNKVFPIEPMIKKSKENYDGLSVLDDESKRKQKGWNVKV